MSIVIVEWNRACERSLRYRAEEIVGAGQALALMLPDEAGLKRALNELQQEADAGPKGKWCLRAKDGTVKTIVGWKTAQRVTVPGWAAWGIGVESADEKPA